MRRPFAAVAVAVVILAATTAGGLTVAACGGSSAGTDAAAASGAPGGQMPDMSSVFVQALDPLVEEGTITSAQEDAVVEALSASLPDRGAQGQGDQPPGQGAQPSPGATPAAGTPPDAVSRPDPGVMFAAALDELVAAGTITADQETAIVEALDSGMQGGPGQGGAPAQPDVTSTMQSY
jgi:hypothetical protein